MTTWQIIAVILAVVGVLAALWLALRARPAQQAPTTAPMASSTQPAPAQPLMAAADAPTPATPRSYNPSKVGNDSAARLWDSAPANVVAEVENEIDHEVQAHSEEGALITQMRNCFIEMQRAWDAADVLRLRAMLMPEMAELLSERLQEREEQGPSPHAAELMVLEARLLSRESTAVEHCASVEFSGMVREAPTQAPTPFREIWEMVQARHTPDAPWRVAAVQPLQ
ncbi:MAG: TIM44-like domain-containing protein [Brachymonas sp.]|nr:TIM44-like domain-containing protein [Brachymonas sp.]